MKAKVLKLVDGAIDNACDDLYRAKKAFDPARVNLDGQYGESGRTRRELLAEYQAAYDDAVAMREWLNKVAG